VEDVERGGTVRGGRVQSHLRAVSDLVERIDFGQAARPVERFVEVTALLEQLGQAPERRHDLVPQTLSLGGQPFREALGHQIARVAPCHFRQRSDLARRLPSRAGSGGVGTCERPAYVVEVRADGVLEPQPDLRAARLDRPLALRKIAPKAVELAAEVGARLRLARLGP
jgi:hypothetical protein